MNNNITLQTIFILSLAAFSQSSLAVVCESESPNHKKQGEKYFEIEESSPLSKGEKKTVKTMFKSLKGRWKGSKTTTVCIGAAGDQKKEISKETVTVQTQLDSGGQLTITFDVYHPEKKIAYNETLNYFGSGFDNQPTIDKLTVNGFTAIYKGRGGGGIGHGPPGHSGFGHGVSVLTEIFTEFKVSKASVSIKSIAYRNGYFAEKTDILLRR